ncbi:hypothetical protein Nepgr_013770 [Nepenthes gracilis]|uniref:Uncharacterized protein n=1 Tax=Nepenthes gracilis TaxID=150966 RepID=A0AAD3SJM1_NEPGR|nr:hypothetical protein Nepgr_013770 [Nepenthes gracilis]
MESDCLLLPSLCVCFSAGKAESGRFYKFVILSLETAGRTRLQRVTQNCLVSILSHCFLSLFLRPAPASARPPNISIVAAKVCSGSC